ncbi:helix-turn-helix domain-containing protein [Halomonas sp. THAF12]|uniref:helix-turn-helix domain-containing protein n=1 Tax=Halomonas sp. THAF12 TaxID=2587849 RepID=UPI00373E016C
MTHCYRHLSAEDRDVIMMMRAIATHLGRVPSTVSRELAPHTVSRVNGYDASLAGLPGSSDASSASSPFLVRAASLQIGRGLDTIQAIEIEGIRGHNLGHRL